MSHPPLRRFLGLDEHSSDRSLLGLSPEDVPSNQSIADALDRRLAELDRHPGARSPAAAAVRRRLGEAAGRVMASSAVSAAEPSAPTVDQSDNPTVNGDSKRPDPASAPAPPPMIADRLPTTKPVTSEEPPEPVDTPVPAAGNPPRSFRNPTDREPVPSRP